MAGMVKANPDGTATFVPFEDSGLKQFAKQFALKGKQRKIDVSFEMWPIEATRTETRSDTNNAPVPRRQAVVQGLGGRTVIQDFDFESSDGSNDKRREYFGSGAPPRDRYREITPGEWVELREQDRGNGPRCACGHLVKNHGGSGLLVSGCQVYLEDASGWCPCKALTAVTRATVGAIMADPLFIAACKLAGIKPTPRQAAKWRNGTGTAWSKRDVKPELSDKRAPRAADDEEV